MAAAMERLMTLAPRVLASLLLAAAAPACSSRHADVESRAAPDADAGPSFVANAVFFDVPPQEHGAPYPARMFTSFHPAEADAAHAPLLVFFNGGPGAATSLALLAYGTGAMTLDPADLDRTVPRTGVGELPTGEVPVAHANSRSFTRFASTLHVDERQAGFSYGIGTSPSSPCRFSVMDDAVDFLRVLLAFFDAHEALRHVPLVLVGESYGGTRAVTMLHALLRYREAALPPDLVDAIQAHLDRVFPGSSGRHPPEEIASHLRAALIEPFVLGKLQYDAQQKLMAQDPYLGQVAGSVDPYDVRRPTDYSDRLRIQAARAFLRPETARDLVGVELDAVPRLAPPSRGEAFRVDTDAPGRAAEASLEAQLGALAPHDAYLTAQSSACEGWVVPGTEDPNLFVEAMQYVPLFITRARFDSIVHTPAIPRVMEDQGWPVTLDEVPRGGVARPGWLAVTIPPLWGVAEKTVQVRFPLYDASGHEVAVTQGGDLADDIASWLASE